MDYAHSKGVIHRDIKPENIAFDSQKKQLRILDWGIGRLYKPGVKNKYNGTRHYASPENLMGLEYYDYQNDIWSAGCVLVEMVFKHS